MLKYYSAVLAALASCLIGTSSPSAQVAPVQTRDGVDCAAVFRGSQALIESLALQGRTNDIQTIFVRAGCAAPTVALPTAQQRSAKAVKPKIHCRFKLLPPSLICTF